MSAEGRKGEPIQVIGLDCDDPQALDHLLLAEPDLLKNADMICGGRNILAQLQYVPELRGKLLYLTPPLDPLYDSISRLQAEGLKVLVLADGDPLFFGIGSSLARRFGTGKLKVRSAISSLQAASCRLNLPWHNIICISLHGRDNLAPLYEAIVTGLPIFILTGGGLTPDLVARLLVDRGADWFSVHVFENMGEAAETHLCLNLKKCSRSHFGKAATIMLLPEKKQRGPRLGLDAKRLYGAYSTKMPVRGAILELLKFKRNQVFWDIGAGSGAFALEACSLLPAGKVIAIERNWQRCLDLQENRRLVGAVNLDICMAEAPDCFDALPQPDRIFLGGGLSGRNVEALLDACMNCLPVGGRFVASCVLLDSFVKCRSYISSLGWPMDILEIQAAYAAPLGSGASFAPYNPVFLLATQKP